MCRTHTKSKLDYILIGFQPSIIKIKSHLETQAENLQQIIFFLDIKFNQFKYICGLVKVKSMGVRSFSKVESTMHRSKA